MAELTERRFQALIEKSYAGVLLLDQASRITYASAACERILGFTVDELIGRSAFDLLHPNETALIRERFAQLLAGTGGGVGMLLQCLHKNGSWRWIEAIGTNLLDDPAVGAVVTNLHDVTDRQIAEAKLRESEASFRQLAEAIPHMVWTASPGGDGEFINRRYSDYSGIDAQELLRDGWMKSVHPEDQSRCLAAWQRALARGEELSTEVRLRASDEHYRWYLCRALPVRDEQGRILRWCGTNTDIDDQKRWQEQLRLAKQVAEEASRLKSGFLANMSHEMRTPLGSILGFADLLQDTSLGLEERQQFLQTVKRNGKLLSRLIDDILDLSKVEAGRLELERLTVSLPNLLNDVVSLLERQASDKGILLSVTSEGELPERITTDPTRLRQVLLNIVGNAIKFTTHGEVTVTVRPYEVAGRVDRSLLAFSVKDTGPGIHPAELPRLFQPFSQADTSTTRRFGGTGLGLALSKRLARLLGGDVTLLESRPGHGSTFLVTIATGEAEGSSARSVASDAVEAAPKAAAAEPHHAHPLSGARVLVVEDSDDNRTLIRRLLGGSGAQVDAAANGIEGVDMALTHDYDVVLMDLQMPVLDGFQATVRLRGQGYRKPIIALTAHAMKEEREKSLRFGCDDHLTKPINKSMLIDTVAHYIGRHPSA